MLFSYSRYHRHCRLHEKTQIQPYGYVEENSNGPQT